MFKGIHTDNAGREKEKQKLNELGAHIKKLHHKRIKPKKIQ